MIPLNPLDEFDAVQRLQEDWENREDAMEDALLDLEKSAWADRCLEAVEWEGST